LAVRARRPEQASCKIESSQANSLTLVRFDTNDYSVPVEYTYHPVVVKGYADRVVIGYGSKTTTEHPQCWKKERAVFNPIHTLPLLKQKSGSMDYARPLQVNISVSSALPAAVEGWRGFPFSILSRFAVFIAFL
jgi:hypothetical protein